MTSTSIAIIGAGAAGLAAAKELHQLGQVRNFKRSDPCEQSNFDGIHRSTGLSADQRSVLARAAAN